MALILAFRDAAGGVGDELFLTLKILDLVSPDLLGCGRVVDGLWEPVMRFSKSYSKRAHGPRVSKDDVVVVLNELQGQGFVKNPVTWDTEGHVLGGFNNT